MVKQSSELSEFERMTYDYITELKDIPSVIKMVNKCDHQKANTLIHCVKNLINYVEAEIGKMKK